MKKGIIVFVFLLLSGCAPFVEKINTERKRAVIFSNFCVDWTDQETKIYHQSRPKAYILLKSSYYIGLRIDIGF